MKLQITQPMIILNIFLEVILFNSVFKVSHYSFLSGNLLKFLVSLIIIVIGLLD